MPVRMMSDAELSKFEVLRDVDQGWPMAGLFMPGLRIERKPDHVAGLGNVGRHLPGFPAGRRPKVDLFRKALGGHGIEHPVKIEGRREDRLDDDPAALLPESTA